MDIYTNSDINNLLKLLAVHYRVVVQLRSLNSTQEARLALMFLSSLFQARGSWRRATEIKEGKREKNEGRLRRERLSSPSLFLSLTLFFARPQPPGWGRREPGQALQTSRVHHTSMMHAIA